MAFNKNGKWDGGSLPERRQPERVELFVGPDGKEAIMAKENWEFFVAMMESQFIETEEDGFTLTTDNDTDNYTFNITLDIDPTLAREDIFSTYGLASLGDYNSTYNEVKEAGVEAGFTCE